MACCLTLQTKAVKADPRPEPPAKFLEPTTVARLASEVKSRSRPATGREERSAAKSPPGRKKRRGSRPRRERTVRPTRLRTVVDRSALDFDTVFVSAGRRGLELELAPDDLVRLTEATVAAIAR